MAWLNKGKYTKEFYLTRTILSSGSFPPLALYNVIQYMCLVRVSSYIPTDILRNENDI